MCAPVIYNTPSLASTKAASTSRTTNSFRATASSSSGEENIYSKPRRPRSFKRNDILLLENASAMIAEARSFRKESSTEPSTCELALHTLFRRRKRASSRSSFQPKNSHSPSFSKSTYNWDSCFQFYSEMTKVNQYHVNVYIVKERENIMAGQSELERFKHTCEEALDTRQERIEDRKYQYTMIRKRKVSFDFSLKGPGHVHNDKHEKINGILRRRD